MIQLSNSKSLDENDKREEYQSLFFAKDDIGIIENTLILNQTYAAIFLFLIQLSEKKIPTCFVSSSDVETVKSKTLSLYMHTYDPPKKPKPKVIMPSYVYDTS